MTSQRTVRGWEDLPKGSERSRRPRKGPKGVWKPYRRAERGWEDLLDCPVGLGGPIGEL